MALRSSGRRGIALRVIVFSNMVALGVSVCMVANGEGHVGEDDLEWLRTRACSERVSMAISSTGRSRPHGRVQAAGVEN